MENTIQETVNAFMRGDNFTSAHTNVYVLDGTTFMKVDNLPIAYKKGTDIIIRDAGFQHRIVEQLLGAIPNVDLSLRDGAWYLNGNYWDGSNTSVPKYYQVDIKWLDTDEEVECLTIKVGDCDDDDRVFFYVDSEDDLMSLYNEGIESFVITAHHSITMD